MDLQELIDNAAKASRQEQFKDTDQLTLGELTILFENVDGNKDVFFDDTNRYPTSLGSWRGSYRELAIRYESDGDNGPLTAAEFLTELREADGATYTGYKGGDYTMGRATPVWVANYGTSSGPDFHEQGVVGVKETNDIVEIVTAETTF